MSDGNMPVSIRCNGSVMSSVDPEEEPYLEQELHEDTVRRMDPVEEIGHAHHQQHGEHRWLSHGL